MDGWRIDTDDHSFSDRSAILFGESSAEELSVEEVKEQMEERFQAQVLSIEEKEDQFEVRIKESNGKYLVFVDSVEGQVLRFKHCLTKYQKIHQHLKKVTR